MLSPADTTIVFGFSALRRAMWAARYSTPPAATVPIRPFDPVGGSSAPWKSLNPRI